MTEELTTDKGEISRQMRLRPAPPPVMRLSRKALMAIGGVSALALAAALGFALLERPDSAAKPELYRVGSPPPETLQTLPADYTRRAGSAAAPQLGPPLPGDLGRPILAAQSNGVDVAPPPMGGTTSEPDAARSAADAARQRATQERDAARTSTLFLNGAAPSLSSTSPVGQSSASPSVHVANPAPGTLSAPPTPFTLQAGAVISGALITGLRSDLPGMAIGQVTDDVYDSVTGHHLLIPKGSRLLGAYEADVSYGQSRLALIWSRLILPDGRSVDLENMRAADPQGYSGLEDRTDNRWGERLRTAALTTLLAVGASAGLSTRDDAIARAQAQGASGGVNAFGQGLVEKGLGVAPRLTIRPGFGFRVIVARDMIFEPYGEHP